MGKFDDILICTDLDGTLYRNDKTISAENKEAIEYFKAEGGYFTFITGRMPYYSQQAYHAVSPNVPFGCINGGGLYDGKKQEYTWNLPLAEGVEELIAHIDKLFPAVGIQVCSFYKTFFCKENEVTVNFRRLTGLSYLPGDYRNINEPKGKVLFCCAREEEILGVEAALRAHPLAENYSFVRSEKKLFEILPKGVNKGLSLAKLIDHLQLKDNKTIAIGDYNNDIGMFRAARYGIAVSNACQAAKDAADRITVSNEQHAIAQVIRDIENGQIQF